MVKKYKLNGIEHVDQLSYYTDGRPQGIEATVETHWRGRALFTSTRPSSPKNLVHEDEWELSRDGNLLTRTLTSTTIPESNGMSRFPQEQVKLKYVFTRKQP
jgi:hypothetical protein